MDEARVGNAECSAAAVANALINYVKSAVNILSFLVNSPFFTKRKVGCMIEQEMREQIG